MENYRESFEQASYEPVASQQELSEGALIEQELLEDELREEELLRRNAIARKRKHAARERRRKKRRREAIIRCSILLVIVILIITGFVKLITGIFGLFHKEDKQPATTQQPVTTQEITTEEVITITEDILAKELPADRQSALTLLEAQSHTDPVIKQIVDQESVYPDKILQCLAINSELAQFVADYPEKISIVFDGNFTVDVSESDVPLFLQYDERWGYADYGNSIIGISGCGPTCLAMAYAYLKQDGSMNPINAADFSAENGFLTESNDTSWSLMTSGAQLLGLSSEELSLSQSDMTNALDSGKVIICSMKPGDFTQEGHFIVIRGYENNLFYVNDPNSAARSEVGWEYIRLRSQISNMWALGAGE